MKRADTRKVRGVRDGTLIVAIYRNGDEQGILYHPRRKEHQALQV